MGIKFLSLSSGSSGNCYFIGTEEEGFLIDAGISARKIKKTLAEHGIDMATIKGVCISHDHADHIAAAGYSKVMLWVFEDNVRARRFYEAKGFITKGKIKPDLEPKEICYEKNL